MARGRKTGGRRKGTPNKATQKQREAIAASGLTALDYLVSVFRDETASRAERIDAAKAAAPYMHARISTVDPVRGAGEQGVPLAERLKEYARQEAIEDSGGKVVPITRRAQ